MVHQDWSQLGLPTGEMGLVFRDHMILYLIKGMKKGIIKPVNYDKVNEITKEPRKNPVIFRSQSHLVEGLQKFTTTDPDLPEG